jgi:8-oxo-dGTP diphosphatase
VHEGETPEQALVRECGEELRARVIPLARLGADVSLGLTNRLRLYVCAFVGPAPLALEHSAIDWFEPNHFDKIPWLASNLELARRVSTFLGAK